METIKIFIFFMFPVFIFTGSLLYSQGFNSVAVSQGTNVTAAGDSGKIFRSFDSGISWSSPSAPSVNFNSISSSGQYTYLTASNNRIYRIYSSFNSSVSEFTISGNYLFNSVYFVNDSTGFICGDNGAVFRTTDEGITWSLQNSGISDLKLNSVSFKDLYNGVIAADNGFIFLTTNSGNSWQSAVTIPLTNNILFRVKYFSDGIAAAGESGTLLLKRNNSPDWESISTRVTSGIYGITGTGINDVHVCGGGGFIRNNKNGNNQFTNFEPNPMMANLTDISMFDSMTGYAVSSLNKAVIRTTNGGISWNFTQGVYAAYTWDRKATAFQTYGNTLCKHPYNNTTFFCGMGNRVYVSRDDGETWSDIAGVPGTSMHSLYISPIDTNIWMCAIKGTPGKIMRTTNYGNNWTTSIAATFSAFGQPLEMDQNEPSVYYFAPDGGGFYRSVDNGISFQLISNYPFQSPCDILVTWDSSEVMFVGDGPTDNSGGKIYRSSDGGYNWNIVFSDSSAIEIPSMSNSVFEKNIVYSTETGPNFWRSTDYGFSFNSFYTTGFYNWASAVCDEDPTLIMDGLYNNSCYFSMNKGIDWISSYGAGAFAGLGLLAPTKNTLLYYTTNGIYKMNIIYHGIVSVNEHLLSLNFPDKFMLYQNYPNPFNPVTNLEFGISDLGFVSLKVYDMLGKEVKILVNEIKSPGKYKMEFDGSGLASGIYFYKLEIDGFSETKSMILLK